MWARRSEPLQSIERSEGLHFIDEPGEVREYGHFQQRQPRVGALTISDLEKFRCVAHEACSHLLPGQPALIHFVGSLVGAAGLPFSK